MPTRHDLHAGPRCIDCTVVSLARHSSASTVKPNVQPGESIEASPLLFFWERVETFDLFNPSIDDGEGETFFLFSFFFLLFWLEAPAEEWLNSPRETHIVSDKCVGVFSSSVYSLKQINNDIQTRTEKKNQVLSSLPPSPSPQPPPFPFFLVLVDLRRGLRNSCAHLSSLSTDPNNGSSLAVTPITYIVWAQTLGFPLPPPPPQKKREAPLRLDSLLKD